MEADFEFEAFSARNPQLLDALIREALAKRLEGHVRMSFRLIWEKVRLEQPNLAHYNDRFHSRYARLVMQREASLAGMFPTRRLRS